jgi:hypothetical protein
MLVSGGFEGTLTEALTTADELEARVEEVAAVGQWKTVTVTVVGVQLNGEALERRGALTSRANGMVFVNILVS